MESKESSHSNKKDSHVLVSAVVCDCLVTIAKKNLEYEEASEVDVYLFEPDYTIAGATGFLLWPGTWVLIDLLKSTELGGVKLRGKRVIELGSGTGLAGLCMAAAGASVMLTDLPSVVSGILRDNIHRNSSSSAAAATLSSSSSSDRLGAATLPATEVEELKGSCSDSLRLAPDSDDDPPLGGSAASSSWPGAVPIGSKGGSACCAALDWSEPLGPQLESAAAKKGLDSSTADMLLAVDVVWLKELLIPFRDTVLGLLQECRPSTPFLLTFLDRAKGAATGSFSSRTEVAGVFEDQGCGVRTYHRQQVEVDGEQLTAEVMEIVLCSKA